MFLPIDFDPQQLTAKDYENPYMGLQAYNGEQAHLFFGRDEAIEHLAEKVAGNNFIVVIGASGTGKSSLVKAGIVPKLLKEGKIVLEIRPGKNPLATLPAEETAFDVLVIDQFEELITQARVESALAFMEKLEAWVEKKKKIIITVRIDFEAQIDKKNLETAWQAGRYLIPPFTPDDLRQVIITPSTRVGRFMEPIELADDIIGEVFHYPGSLPLLSFTLSELFNLCKDDVFRNISRADYKALGAVTGSLQKSADRIVADLQPPEQQTLKYIMLRMVSLSSDEIAGKRIMKADLVFDDADEKDRVDAVINKLEDARLIVNDVDMNAKTYIEPAHDALIRAWRQLHTWIKEFGEDNLYLLNKLNADVADYKLRKEKEIFLWHNNPALEQAIQLKSMAPGLLNTVESAFVEKSREKNASEIEALKQERDEAVRQKLLAEKKTRELQNVALFTKYREKNPTLALNIARYNLTRHDESASNYDNFNTVISNRRNGFFRHIFQFTKEDSSTTKVMYAADGKSIINANFDGLLRFWDLNTGNLTKSYPVTGIDITMIQDDQYYLSGDNTGVARVTELETGAVVQEFRGHEKIIWSVDCSPSGNEILTGSGDQTAKMWNLKDGTLIRTFIGHKAEIHAVAFSPDGNTICTGSDDAEAMLWDIKTGKHLLTLKGHDSNICSVAFSPCGAKVLTGSADDLAILWDKNTGQIIHTLKGHDDLVCAVVFSPDGVLMLTGSGDRTAKLWRTSNGKLVQTLAGSKSGIETVAFAPDGKSVVCSGYDPHVYLWNIECLYPVQSFAWEKESSTYAAFSRDGQEVLTCGGDTYLAKLWNTQSGEPVRTFGEGTQYGGYGLISPDSARILTLEKTSEQGRAQLWERTSGKEIPLRYPSFEKINSILFDRDANPMLLAQQGKDTLIWDLLREKSIVTLDNEVEARCIDFSPDGKTFVTNGENNKISLWSIRSGKMIGAFSGHSDEVLSCSFSPDGKQLLTASEDTTAILWDVKSRLPLLTLSGQEQRVTAAVFSPDQKMIMTCSDDADVKIWDSQKGKTLMTINWENMRARNTVFAPDGQSVLVGYMDQMARIWELPEPFMAKSVYPFSTIQLRENGLYLEPADLFSLYEQGEALWPEELQITEKIRSGYNNIR